MNQILAKFSSLVREFPNQPFLLTQNESLSYDLFFKRFHEESYQLSQKGIRNGDRVKISMTSPIESMVSIFAAWKLGSIPVLIRPDSPFESSIPDSFGATQINDSGEMIVFTSGSMGKVKGVRLNSFSLLQNALHVSEIMGLSSNDRFLIQIPVHYLSALLHVFTLMVSGGSLVFEPGFSWGEEISKSLVSFDCTGYGGTPIHLERMLRSRSKLSSRVRFWVSSGDYLSPSTIEETCRLYLNLRLFCMYGLTEGAGRVSVLDVRKYPQKIGSVGLPIGLFKVSVVNDDGKPCSPNTVGEILVSGGIMPYLNELVEEPFHTGDLGTIDEDGFLWFEGRKDDVFKRGGEKVSLLKIRDAILKTHLVKDVALRLAYDGVTGKAPIAFVVLSDHATLIELKNKTESLLPPSHRPKFIPTDVVPRIDSGKLKRIDL